ncbi:MAG: 4-hydroxybenzoate octaprenyltransferase [Bacteroidetes bacterium CG2_30_33_31]|nr:MAG: 4-hydroxybenzoate octaprenyltransferase [Bacteroidetes bacterium CG2_30_33_31]
MSKIKNYLSFIKFAHSIFAMPFALLGFFMALNINNLTFDFTKLIYIILAMIFARNSAMGFNRYIDRNIDKNNPRTKNREIPAGIINQKSALIFVIINSLLFIATTYFINTLCLWLSPIALAVILGYSITKKFTALCHLVLGLGLSLSPIGAYVAVTASFNSILPIIISLAVLLWTAGFDIIYALQDDEFDTANKLNSIPQKLGRQKALLLSRILHFISALLILITGFMMAVSAWYFVGTAVFITLLINQHHLVKIDDLSKVNLAFFTMNGIASVIFGIFSILSFYI